jgi:hypothetical protein
MASAAVVLLPVAGCGFAKGVGKASVGAVKTTGRVVTWPVRAAQGKTGKNAPASAPVVGAGTMVEPGTVIVGARPVDESTAPRTASAGANPGRPRAGSTPSGAYDGSGIYIDGLPVESPSQVATTPSRSGRNY